MREEPDVLSLSGKPPVVEVGKLACSRARPSTINPLQSRYRPGSSFATGLLGNVLYFDFAPFLFQVFSYQAAMAVMGLFFAA